MSDAFSQTPPVYAANSGQPRPPTYPVVNPTPYPNNPPTYSTPYPVNPIPYPTSSSMPMPSTGHPSYPYSQGYAQNDIPENVYRNSIQSAVLDKVRYRLKEAIQLANVEIDSMKKAEQDLRNGEKKIQSLITEAQQQQVQAQVCRRIFFPSFE